MKKIVSRTIILIVCFSMLACGFRLRGAIGLPEGLNSIFIEGIATYSPLNVELRKIFIGSDATIEDIKENAAVILLIKKESFKRRVMTVDSQARAAEYQLVYIVEFELVDRAGVILVPLQKITVIRDYRFDPNNVLAKEQEEAQIRRDMLLFTVRQMMRRIDSNLKAAKEKKASEPAVSDKTKASASETTPEKKSPSDSTIPDSTVLP